MIVVDENVDDYWVRLIEKEGYQFVLIRSIMRGASDEVIMNFLQKSDSLLITEDKDFGELVYAHKMDMVSILLMRYDQTMYNQIEHYFVQCLKEYFLDPYFCFITITKNKIRYRKI